MIFFTNFLALVIKAEVADKNSAGSAIYSAVLIIVNVMFFLSIWWNTWATMKATFSRRGFQVRCHGTTLMVLSDGYANQTAHRASEAPSLFDIVYPGSMASCLLQMGP